MKEVDASWKRAVEVVDLLAACNRELSRDLDKLIKDRINISNYILPFISEDEGDKSLLGAARDWHPFENLPFVRQMGPLLGMDKSPKGPSALRMFEYGQPRVTQAMRPKGESIVPGAPGRRRRSIRGRIV